MNAKVKDVLLYLATCALGAVLVVMVVASAFYLAGLVRKL